MLADLELAKSAALAGGTLVRSRAGTAGLVHSKSTAIDLVSETDVQAGVEVVRTILAAAPDARFVIEEEEVYHLTGATRGTLDDDRVWVIDPIDGTTSFLHGYPCYSVSVALAEGGEVVAGAVYNAAADEMNSAGRGLGAFRDGRRLSVASAETINSAVLVTGFPYDRTDPLESQIAVLSAFLRHPVQDIRRDGSAAVDCCHVAAGTCDGYWEFSLRPWDLAAGVLIAQEAGAVATDVRGRPWALHTDSICIANPIMHEAMLQLIASALATR